MTFRLNDRLNQLIGVYSQTDNPQTKAQNLLNPNLPKSDMDNDFFKGRTWNPYAEIQHMQNEMEHMFDDSFSAFSYENPFRQFKQIA